MVSSSGPPGASDPPIFTGTPAGVGIGRTPPPFLAPGQVLESWIEGIGTIRNHVVARGAA